MARCHRIGQERDVTVYRLLSRNTYEEAIFQTASRKASGAIIMYYYRVGGRYPPPQMITHNDN